MGFWSAFGQAAASAGTGLAGPLTGAYFQSQNNKFNREQARIGMEFEKDMSNTAYRRAVADMKAAGLNPILAAGGSPASTPSAQVARGESLVDAKDLSNAISSAMDFQRLKNETDTVNSQLALNNEKIKTEQTVQQLNGASSAKTLVDAGVSRQQVKSVAAEAALKQAQQLKTWQDAQVSEIEKYRGRMENELLKASMPGAREAMKNEYVSEKIKQEPSVRAIDQLIKRLPFFNSAEKVMRFHK